VAEPATPLERALALRRVPGLEDADPGLLATLAPHVELRRLAAGERLDGARPRVLHFVLDGALGGRARHEAGSLLGQPLGGGTDAVALEESAVLAFDLDEIAELCEERFSVLLAAVRAIARDALRRARAAAPSDAGSAAAPAPPRDVPSAGAASGLGARIALLASCPAFAAIPVHAVGELAQAARPLALRAGERLWRAGDPSGWLVAVGAGALEARAERSRFAVGRCAVAGLLESIAAEPRWYTATARTAVSGLAVDVGAVYDAAEDDSETAADLLAALVRSWRQPAGAPPP